MIQIQDNISEQKNLKDKLESEQEKLHVEYNKVSNTDLRFVHLLQQEQLQTRKQDVHVAQ